MLGAAELFRKAMAILWVPPTESMTLVVTVKSGLVPVVGFDA